jgi:Schlafen, AlbA_2
MPSAGVPRSTGGSMTPDELRARILRWEDPHTDFKEAIERNGDLAKNLVCFANSDGGQLVIGVAKDRSVVGVADTDSLLLRVDDVVPRGYSCSRIEWRCGPRGGRQTAWMPTRCGQEFM